MEINPLLMSGAFIVKSPMHSDQRGVFWEWYKNSDFLDFAGIDFSAKQANISVNKAFVVRGIHYSLSKIGQSKLVTCLSGSIIDVVVDIRVGSPTFGAVAYIELDSLDGRSVLIGAGLGHGFISLENNTVVAYMLDSEYSPKEEYEINPMDSDLDIDWGKHIPKDSTLTLSEKDLNAPTLQNRARNNLLPFHSVENSAQ
jgi:dTDP-4-dehydrorhamnose 3,5-epimerase